jgi:hypothetical protein
VYDGDAAIVYGVTASGELWWRRQEAPGAALGAPVRVADTINWHHDVIFAAAPGSGNAVGVWDNMSYCVWRYQDPSGTGHDDWWYPSGRLPPSVSGVTGDRTWLYGAASDGSVVMLQQAVYVGCPLPPDSIARWTVIEPENGGWKLSFYKDNERMVFQDTGFIFERTTDTVKWPFLSSSLTS